MMLDSKASNGPNQSTTHQLREALSFLFQMLTNAFRQKPLPMFRPEIRTLCLLAHTRVNPSTVVSSLLELKVAFSKIHPKALLSNLAIQEMEFLNQGALTKLRLTLIKQVNLCHPSNATPEK